MAPEVVDISAPLLIAARTGRLPQAQRLLKDGANPDIHTAAGWTPLHAASWNKHPAIVKLLIQHHASLELKFKNRTPLQKAAERGYLEVAQILIDGGADIQAGAPGGFTPLRIAAEGGFDAVVELLLDHNVDINAPTANGWTALHGASYHGRLPVVKVLVRRGADMEAMFMGSRTPLHKAAEAGYAKVAQELLEGKADINAMTNDCQTSLHLAATKGHDAVVKLLLERGTEVDARTTSGWTPLHEAANEGKKAVVEMLLQNDALRDATVDHSKFTALHQAAAKGFDDIVDLLLNHGANIEAKSADSSTPLHLAAMNGHAKVVKLLLKRHANQTAKNKALKTPLSLAEDNNHDRVITLLSVTDQQDDGGSSTTNDASLLASGKQTAATWLRKIDDYNYLIGSAAPRVNKTGSSVRVAVLDTGCDAKASYFSANPTQLKRIKGDHWHDFAGSKSGPVDEDKNQHGTMVSLLLLRVARNAEIFVARIAKTASELGSAAGNIEKAIQHAQDPKGWNADIVCMSFGFGHKEPLIQRAMQQAEITRNGSIVFFVAAANNGSNEREMFPAYLPSVISVRGTDCHGTFVGAYDPPPMPMNEGLPLYGTLGENVPYAPPETSSGCSVATPIMAGMVAMVMQWIEDKAADKRAQEQLRTPAGVRELLKSTSVGKGNNRYYVHIWDLFANNGGNCVTLVEGAMSRLPC